MASPRNPPFSTETRNCKIIIESKIMAFLRNVWPSLGDPIGPAHIYTMGPAIQREIKTWAQIKASSSNACSFGVDKDVTHFGEQFVSVAKSACALFVRNSIWLDVTSNLLEINGFRFCAVQKCGQIDVTFVVLTPLSLACSAKADHEAALSDNALTCVQHDDVNLDVGKSDNALMCRLREPR